MMKKAVAALFLLAVPLVAGDAPKRVTKKNISIMVPNGWSVVDDDPRPETVLSVRKTPAEKDALVPAGIDVGLMPVPEDAQKFSLEALGRLMAESLMSNYEDVVVEVPFRSTHIGKEAAVEWGFHYKGDVEGQKALQVVYVVMLRNGTDSYLIAYHGPQESSAVAHTIIQSFAFVK